MGNNSKMNITELVLENVNFGEKRLNFFAHLKLEKLHTLKISIKNFSKEIPSHLINSCKNSVSGKCLT